MRARTIDDLPRLSGAGLLGHLGEYARDPRNLFLRFNAECGDFGRIRVATIPMVVANAPSLVDELLVRHAKHTRKSRLLRTVLYPLVGEGLFTSEGELWRRQRRLMAPLFQPSQLPAYGPAMTDAAQRASEQWSEGEIVDIAREATRITMSIAARTLFDIDVFNEADELGEALTETLSWAATSAESPAVIGQVEMAGMLERLAHRVPNALRRPMDRLILKLDAPILWPTARNRRLRRGLQILESRVHRMIADRQSSASSPPRSDLLSGLLQAREEDGSAMSERQVRDEILTLFVAGHETTATALAWTFHLLSSHPGVYARVLEEVDALGAEVPSARNIGRLALCQRVFKEALRLYPPVPLFEREALEEFELGGVTIRRGMYLVVFPFALHHREELWPDAARFDPDRFLPELEKARPRHAWIPFGAGPRICIGNGFALLEGTLVLAALLQRVRLQAAYDGDVGPDTAAATFRPKGRLQMRVHRREAEARRTRADAGSVPAAQ
ncbi:MAG TPA: cytochrome P450 [Myxococcaceae bacterium]|nr:cytochrome P450 [Myxococcaceae bacterium]